MNSNPYYPSMLPVEPSPLSVRAKSLVWPIIAAVLLVMLLWSEYRDYARYSKGNNAWTDAVHEYSNSHPEFRDYLNEKLR